MTYLYPHVRSYPHVLFYPHVLSYSHTLSLTRSSYLTHTSYLYRHIPFYPHVLSYPHVPSYPHVQVVYFCLFYRKIFNNGPQGQHLWIGAAEAVIESGKVVWSSSAACCGSLQWGSHLFNTTDRECVGRYSFRTLDNIKLFKEPCTRAYVALCEKLN